MRRALFVFAYLGFVTWLLIIAASVLIVFALWLFGREMHGVGH